MRIPKDDYLVTVCAECLLAACWHGDYMCERADTAKTVDMPASKLREMKREHPSHFSKVHIQDVTGG